MTNKIIPLGTKTVWGKVAAVGCIAGERYYWMVKRGVVSMIPADAIPADAIKTETKS